jgi:CyaY protein
MSDDFDMRARTAMEHLREALEVEPALDVEEKADGVLEVELEDGAKMIVNRHAAAREIWVAARAGGFHYRWDGSAWRDTRDGSELFASLSRLIEKSGGPRVALTPPPAG